MNDIPSHSIPSQSCSFKVSLLGVWLQFLKNPQEFCEPGLGLGLGLGSCESG